ncbi:ARM repeat superfamily protein [Citrus sinensis]|nr:ARM repeat superfamily protein [Citrus sinensis]
MGFEEAAMERNATACAMEWSIELEKGLRSKIPGRCVEAILQIEPRLKQWAGEPEATMVVYNMFGLVPGEERLFANTIFLRLAEAFQLGHKHIRVSIVRVFLSLRRHCRDKKRSKRIKGILSKSRVHNHLELLKRVKIVFDTGDPESRALALVLFGCWADFAKDSAHIRYLVLSSLVSSNVLEVRASLFAAGCFSELADDFASVLLEMLVNLVTYSETESTVRIAAARVFAKMGCSYSVAKRAYKLEQPTLHGLLTIGQVLSLLTGLKLVLDSSDEDFLVAMLTSLSKLAYKSTLLISEQVDFLLHLLNREKALHIQATALRCLYLTFVKGMGQSLISATLFRALFNIVEEAELPSTMQCEALKLLHKILLGRPPNLSCADMPEFAELLRIVDNASRSPIISKSIVAILVLVEIVIKFQRRVEMGSGGVCTLPMPSEVVSLIMDRITLLVKSILCSCQFNHVKVFEQVQSLLSLLLLLVGEHPDLGVLVLNKVHYLIEDLVDTCTTMAGRQADSAVNNPVEIRGERDQTINSKLIFILNRFVVSCLEILNKAGTLTNQVFDKVKLLVQSVHHCSFFDCYTHIIYSLLLDTRTVWICMINRNDEARGDDGNFHTCLQDFIDKHELLTLEFAKKMLIHRDTWPAYRAGMYAACQGAWVTASFLFGQLIMKVQSGIFSCWLKSVSHLAHSQRIIQLLFLTKHDSSSVDWLETKELPITFSEDNLCEIEKDVAGIIDEPNHSQALVVAYQSLISAERTLETTFTSTNAFFFQRWFLALRAKLLGAVMEMFRVLSTIQSEQKTNNDALVRKCTIVDSIKFLQQITQISFQLKRLSQEFDLIATSFIGIDSKSSNIIKAVALNCSLLAVSAGFAFYIPSLPAYQNLTCGLGSSQKCSHAMLIQNLVGRLWNLDHEVTSNLGMLAEVIGLSKNCFHLQSKNQILDSSCEVKNIVDVCNYAVSGIVCWQNEAKMVQDDKIRSEVITNGSQLLLNIILKLMNIPFRVPKFFFKVRPCVGSELFISSADVRNVDGISVSTGFPLSLNLCLQLKNVPPDLPVRLTKFYCILHCSQKLVLDGQSNEKTPWSPQPWEDSDVVEINEMLFQYVTECTKRTNYRKCFRDGDINNDGAVTVFVHFELSARGQGFSNCLLDVSHFPVGSYRIKWHCCCIDSQGSYWSLLPLNAEPVFTVLS